MQNWNDGKAQEFRDRKVYNIGRSRLTHTGPIQTIPETAVAAEATEAAEQTGMERPISTARAMLFVSATCPNCKLAVSMLEKAGFPFKKVLATENVELTNKYGVKQAPTLVVMDGEEFEKHKGVSEIKGMLNAKLVRSAG